MDQNKKIEMVKSSVQQATDMTLEGVYSMNVLFSDLDQNFSEPSITYNLPSGSQAKIHEPQDICDAGDHIPGQISAKRHAASTSRKMFGQKGEKR